MPMSASFLYLIFPVVGALVCWLGITLILRFYKQPASVPVQFHHSHKQPISRFGGLALAVSFVVLFVMGLVFLPAGDTPLSIKLTMGLTALSMFFVGFIDDLRPLGARVKLLCQILVATAAYLGGIRVEVFQLPFTTMPVDLGAISFFATVGWLVVLTNLINLIDGIDGLAAGISFMLVCLLALVGFRGANIFLTILAAGFAGTLLSFLRFNFPPAKIYMGDGGAYFLGFFIGAFSIVNSQKGTILAALIAPVFALALPIADTLLAIIRRWAKGLPIFRPDRKHLHHKLLDKGLSRSDTLLILYGCSLLFLAVAFVVFWSQGRLIPIMAGTVCLFMLVALRSSGVLKGWLQVSEAFGLRKKSRYALALGNCLLMEADDCEKLSELEFNYFLILKKLRFHSMTIKGPYPLSWRDQPNSNSEGKVFSHIVEVQGNKFEFQCHEGIMCLPVLKHMSDLAAEIWINAYNRWQTKHPQLEHSLALQVLPSPNPKL